MAESRLAKDFTKGSIPRQLFWFTLPFMASNALQVLYSTVDMIFVGTYVRDASGTATAALSAVSQSSQIVNFATMVTLGFANAGQVLISQAAGSGKRREMNTVIGTLCTLITALAVLLTLVMLVPSTWILQMINVPKESFAMAKEYLVICAAGMLFTAGYNTVSAVLRGMGDSKRPFLFIGIATGVNLVLDWLFVGVLGWGVAGAAYATIIGQAVSFIFSLAYLYRRREAFGFAFEGKRDFYNRRYVRMIFGIGMPMAIQSGFINLSMLYVNSMINSIGVVESATFGVGMRIDDIVNKISQGIQHAAMPMISQNIGAGRRDRAVKVVHAAWVFSGITTVFFMLMYILFGKQMFMLFSDDPSVHAMSGTFISAILWMFPAFAVMRGSGAFIQGIGNAKLCMVLALLDGVVLRVGLSWLFGIALGWGFYGFVLGYGLAPYGYAVPSMLYFLSGVWKKQKTLAEKL